VSIASTVVFVAWEQVGLFYLIATGVFVHRGPVGERLSPIRRHRRYLHRLTTPHTDSRDPGSSGGRCGDPGEVE
jgi:hypothetical protein